MKKTMLIMLSLIIMCTCAYTPAMAAYDEAGYGIVFVSSDGNDDADGSYNRPLKTIAEAQLRVRSMKGTQYPKGITIYIRGGDYNLSEPIKFTSADSGTKDAPITYRAYNDEKVTITAGVTLNGNDFTKVRDEAILNRLAEESAKDKIYMVDLKKYGIKDLGQIKWFGIDSYGSGARASGVQPVTVASPEVFFDGEPLQIARYPDSGFAKTGKVIDYGWSVDYPDRAPTGAPNTFEFKESRIKKWAEAEPGTILLDGYWKFDWSEQTLPIASIDTSKMTITTTHGATFSLEEGKNFYAYNLIEELSKEGEYYLDYDNSILYLIPPTDISKARITMSAMQENLVQFKGASYINIRGLDFTGCRMTAIDFDEKSHDNEVSDADISYTAKVAVYTRGYNNGIRDSYIHDVDGGINLDGGDVPTLTDGNCYITNCEIERFSRLTSTYTPAIHLAGVGNIATHNEIHDGPHMAIQIGSQFAKVYYNDIYDVLNGGNDAGAIYGYMNWTFIGNEFKYNAIHDCANPNARGSTVDGGGIVGFYMDGGLSWNVIVGNVIYDFAGTAYALNGGRDNIVANNISDNCTLAFETTSVMSGGINNDSRKNGHLQGKDYLYSDAWKQRYPKFNEWLYEADTERCKPKNNVVRNNLFLNGTFTIARAQAVIDIFYDMSENFIGGGDPGFVDLQGRDYNLKKDSKISEYVPDFKPIAFSRIGRVNKNAESRVSDSVVLAIDSGNALVDGKEVMIDEDPAVIPFAEDGVTYIPIRFLAESLGAGVDWKDGKVIISSDTVNLEFVPGELTATKNGESITMENASRVVNQRTMIPLREISELLEKEVLWFAPGFVSVSDEKDLFLESDTTDMAMADYLYAKLNKH